MAKDSKGRRKAKCHPLRKDGPRKLGSKEKKKCTRKKMFMKAATVELHKRDKH
jgi:hypothetical protein